MWSLDSAFHVSMVATCGWVSASQQQHVGLEQQAEPVAAVRLRHGGVVLVGDLGPLASTATTVWPAELAGLPVPGDDPVSRLPCAELRRSS